MPYSTKWVEPEIFTSHLGVTIYHTYKDDDLGNGAATFWYTTHSNDCLQEFHFDVRDLATRSARTISGQRPRPEAIRAVLHEAIQAGVLRSAQEAEASA